MLALSKLGVRGTPAFFINGRYLSGAQPIESFKAVIDEELKKADEAIKGGVKAEDYYRTAIMEKGKKTI
jgi:predicted DsbA family dithiol-disulfide isomerase